MVEFEETPSIFVFVQLSQRFLQNFAQFWKRLFELGAFVHVLNHPKVRGKWFNFEHQVMHGFNHIFDSDS